MFFVLEVAIAIGTAAEMDMASFVRFSPVSDARGLIAKSAEK